MDPGHDHRSGDRAATLPTWPIELLVRRSRDNASGTSRQPRRAHQDSLRARRHPRAAPPVTARDLDERLRPIRNGRARAERHLRYRRNSRDLRNRTRCFRHYDGPLGRVARRHQPRADCLFPRGPNVFLARPGHLPLLVADLGPKTTEPFTAESLARHKSPALYLSSTKRLPSSGDHSLCDQSDCLNLHTPARFADGWDTRTRRAERFPHMAAMAERSPRSSRGHRAMGRPLHRSSARIPQRPADTSDPPGYPDRVYRRQFPGVARPNPTDRLGHRATGHVA